MRCINCRGALDSSLNNLCSKCIWGMLNLLHNPPTHCTRCGKRAVDVAILVVQCELGILFVCVDCVDSVTEVYGRDDPHFDPLTYLVNEFKESKVGKMLKKYDDQLKG